MTTYELNIKELDKLIYFIARFLHDKNPDFNHPFRMSVDTDIYLQYDYLNDEHVYSVVHSSGYEYFTFKLNHIGYSICKYDYIGCWIDSLVKMGNIDIQKKVYFCDNCGSRMKLESELCDTCCETKGGK